MNELDAPGFLETKLMENQQIEKANESYNS